MSVLTRPSVTERRPFLPEDYRAFPGAADLPDWAQSRAPQYARLGPAYSWLVDGRIACSAGLIIQWPGLATAWTWLNDEGRRHPFVARSVRRALYEAIERHGLRRVESEICDGEGLEIRETWMDFLGFERESAQPLKGPNGETFYLYVILRRRR